MIALNSVSQKLKLALVSLLGLGTLAVIAFGHFSLKATGPLMDIQFQAQPTSVKPADKVTYDVNVKNTGTVPLNNLRISQQLSSSVTYETGSTIAKKDGSQITIDDGWIQNSANLGTLDVNTTVTLEFKVKVNSNVPGGTNISSVVQVKSDEIGWTPATAQISVQDNNAQTVLRGGNFLKVANNTQQTAEGDTVNAAPYEVVEFFVRINVDGTSPASDVNFLANLPFTNAADIQPTARLSSGNAPSVEDSVIVHVSQPSRLIYKNGFGMIYGVSSNFNCPNGCALPNTIYYQPLNIGTVNPGNTASIQIKYKADVIPLTPASPSPSVSPSPSPSPSVSPSPSPSVSPSPSPSISPSPSPSASPSPTPSPTPLVCNSVCSSNSQCASNLFCFIPNGQSQGNCRLATNQNDTSCQPPVTPTPTPTPGPGCNTNCNQDSDCPSNLFCYKQNGQNGGICRLNANPSSITCETSNEGGFIVMKFEDDNGNGFRDDNEQGLDWSFQWDLNGDNNWRDYQTYATNNGAGGRVGGLHDGDQIRVREIGKGGWTPTTATEQDFTISQGNTITVRFGNKPTQPTVTTVSAPPTKLPSTGVDIIAQMFGSIGLGGFGVYLRRRKTGV